MEKQKRLLYLDIDGVLNGHEKHTNGFSVIRKDCTDRLNSILDQAPDVKLVISSAWRYLVLEGSMYLGGFESLLLTHGVKCYGRVSAVTDSDEEYIHATFPNEAAKSAYLAEHSVAIRSHQIHSHVRTYHPSAYAVLDDLDLCMRHQVQTDPNFGLSGKDVTRVLRILDQPCILRVI